MKILVLKENKANENRVALTPDLINKYQKFGFDIYLESQAGQKANFTDDEYIKNGAKIIADINQILPEIDLIIAVSRHEFNYKITKPNAFFVALINPLQNQEFIQESAKSSLNVFALDLIPRITRAQAMDVLSSQSNLAGYRAVIDAAYEAQKVLPMMMTAAGTVAAAKFLILGAGVAGLQAIATAKRLGAIVLAFDVRASAKEQVESLGAKFVEVKSSEKIDGVYASAMSADYKLKQQELLAEVIKSVDVVISTAQIPAQKAPILITQKMVESMKSNAIIVDIAAASGGNCELTKINEIYWHNSVKIIGYENYPSRVAHEASKFYAKNILNFVEILIDKDKKILIINNNDEIIKATFISSKNQ